MSFIGSSIAVGLGAAAGSTAAMVAGAAVTGSLVSAGTSIYAASQNKKAINSAINNQKSVDVGKLASDARTNAETNLRTALDLESKYLPQQAELRGATGQNFLNQLNPEGTAAGQRNDALMRALGFDPGAYAQNYGGNALTQSAADSIMADLALGGKLDPETQAQVVRAGLARGGNSGILGSDAGRGLVARDLGLTSLQLQQSRQQNALNAGMAQSQLGLNASQQYLQSLGLGLDATSGSLINSGNLYGLLANQPLPEAGLSSGDLASVNVGQTNAYNQNLMTAAGISAANNSAKYSGISNAIQSGLGMYADFAGGKAGLGGAGTTLGTTGSPNPYNSGGLGLV